VLAGVLVCAASVLAQEPLVCGVPLLRTLPPGGVHSYRITTPPGAAVLIQSSAVSPSLGLRRMRLTGPGGALIDDRSTGIIEFTGRAGELTLQVSQNSGNTGGDYTVALNIKSGGSGNCGRPLACGATPAGTGFAVPGAVDAFQIQLEAGEPGVGLRVNYLEPPRTGEAGAPYLRLFDPDGKELAPGQCAASYAMTPQVSGIYTALVSACGAPARRDYRIELSKPFPACPKGPTITHFGITNAQSDPIAPSGIDAEGRPIFIQQLGFGLHVVLEARSGTSGRRAGEHTTSYDLSGAMQDPDLQMILERPLGDGNPMPCDISLPDIGGVPATVPLEFQDTPETYEHIEDMGCRFDNGRGDHLGHRDSLDACTRTNQGFGESFVDRASSIQFCTGAIDSAWSFPDGPTIVKARVKDTFGNFGSEREIVVRIGDSVSPTPTFTRTPIPPSPTATRTSTVTRTRTMPSTLPPTRTPTRTRTATRTGTPTTTPGTPGTPTVTLTPDGRTPTATQTRAPRPCPSDCNGDGMVSIDELIATINIALTGGSLETCPAGDVNGDGVITVTDLVQAVNSALAGCPA
jgi:hypothetical protein